MDTSRHYAASDEAEHQLDCIWTARQKFLTKITVAARKLQAETGASEKDTKHFLDHVEDGLSDMLDSVTMRWKGEKDAADEAIGNVEERDLQLSRMA